MSRLWLCMNHPELGTTGVKFESEKPVCPECGADGDSPDSGGCVAPRVVIHFIPPHPVVKNRGTGVLACDPKTRVGLHGMMATGDPREATCPACRASDAWKQTMEQWGTPPAYRVPPVPAKAQPAN